MYSSSGSATHGVGTRAPVHSRGTTTASASPRANAERWFPVSCNKCQQPAESTVFVCSCRCLFCESCAYSHFQSSAHCPACGIQLGENDFTEVTIADPSNTLASNPDQIYQNFLTRTATNAAGAPLSWNDVCAALIREQDALFNNVRFFVKQFVREAQKSLREGKNAIAQVQAYRKQLAVFKEDTIRLKRQHEEDTERLRQKDRQLAEKDRQLQQLKTMLGSSNSSSAGTGTNSRWQQQQPQQQQPTRSRSSVASSSMRISQWPGAASAGGFRNYVRKKEARELEQERDLMNHITRKQNPMAYRQHR